MVVVVLLPNDTRPTRTEPHGAACAVLTFTATCMPWSSPMYTTAWAPTPSSTSRPVSSSTNYGRRLALRPVRQSRAGRQAQVGAATAVQVLFMKQALPAVHQELVAWTACRGSAGGYHAESYCWRLACSQTPADGLAVLAGPPAGASQCPG